MSNNKIFILLPDGIGLRNFAYSNFYQIGKDKKFDVVFWNNTSFPLSDLGFSEIKINDAKVSPKTNILKAVKLYATLNLFEKRSNDSVYQSYKFPLQFKGIKSSLKSILCLFLIKRYSSEKRILKLDDAINKAERNTAYYKKCLETLQQEKPSIVFTTNQRQILSVAPLLAAKDLNIPTVAFIFSWDNLPKATLVVNTDFYFVWSEHMKQELLHYYPQIKEEQITITGTPQFEMHFDKKKLLSRAAFFDNYKLDSTKKYICFSGDDYTSSPDDPKYLRDLALAVRKLNSENFNLGIIFRKCPVDFSNRYDDVITEFKDLIVPIDPLWKTLTTHWDSILPQKEDDALLSSIAEHCEMVVNLGSSMVFDFVAHQKPCGYFRYNQKNQLNEKWDIFKCYQFVHFRSMPNENSVFWLDNPEEIAQKIETILSNNSNVANAQKWFEKINQHPPQIASERIWNAIEEICKIQC